MEDVGYIIFGCRSPLVVDYEESLARCGVTLHSSVSVEGAPRVLDHSKVMSLQELEDWKVKNAASGFITCAFSADRRRELVRLATEAGLTPAQALIDPTAVIPSSLRVGAGTFVNAAAVIGGATFVGSHVLINRAASIGHHSFIGDYVSIAPGVTLASNVRIGEGVTSVAVGLSPAPCPTVFCTPPQTSLPHCDSQACVSAPDSPLLPRRAARMSR